MTKKECLMKYKAEIDLAIEHLSHAIIWGYTTTPDEIEGMARLLAARDLAIAALDLNKEVSPIIERWKIKERKDVG